MLSGSAIDLDDGAGRHLICRPRAWTIACTSGTHWNWGDRRAASDRPAQTLQANRSDQARDASGRSVVTCLYWSRMRVPLIFWLLRVLRKLGISRSISSK